jgi:hypothetical protein
VVDGGGAPDPSPEETIVPGRITTVDERGLRVGTVNGVYRIRRLLFFGRVHAAEALAAEIGLGPGSALSHNPAFLRPG